MVGSQFRQMVNKIRTGKFLSGFVVLRVGNHPEGPSK